MATLTFEDLFSPGDRQLVLDTQSGLTWLNISQTTLRSYDEISAGYGGFIGAKGFRYATGAEVGTLLANYGISELLPGTYSTGIGHGLVTSLMTSYLGVTWANYNSRAIVGITADNDTFNGVATHHFAYLYSNDFGQWTASQYWGQVYNDYAGQPVPGWEISSFLVKSPVPEPASLLLLGAGTTALLMIKRARRGSGQPRLGRS